jgi:hypothetical protein
MNEDPAYDCDQCDCELKRVYHSFGLSHGKRLVQRKIEDKLKAESDMKQDMKENHGIESFQPIAAQSVAEVYNDVKASGSYVKERMAAETEKSEVAQKKKATEWKRKALKRAPRRQKERAERKAAEAAKKRTIRL